MFDLLEPAAALIVGLIGLAGVLATMRQRAAAEAAQRFWSRLMWALDAAMDDDPRTRQTGERTLHVLMRHPECTDEDRRLIRTVLDGNRRHYRGRRGTCS